MSEFKPDWHTMVEGGRWNANALRLLPRSAFTWAATTRDARILMHGRKTIAKVTRVGHGDEPHPWRTRLYGFEFATVPGVGAARIGVKWSSVRGFATADEAVAFIDRALVEMPLAATPEVLEPVPVAAPDAETDAPSPSS